MLPDLLQNNLKLVVCGTAVGQKSASLQRYYAGPGNKFWRTIYEVRLTSLQLRPDDYKELLQFGIGLTDLVKSKVGNDSILHGTDFGISVFTKKIKEYQPRHVCFNGKRAAEEYLQRSVSYGTQPEKIDCTILFIAPSTSSAANGFWDIDYWYQLSNLCRELKDTT